MPKTPHFRQAPAKTSKNVGSWRQFGAPPRPCVAEAAGVGRRGRHGRPRPLGCASAGASKFEAFGCRPPVIGVVCKVIVWKWTGFPSKAMRWFKQSLGVCLPRCVGCQRLLPQLSGVCGVCGPSGCQRHGLVEPKAMVPDPMLVDSWGDGLMASRHYRLLKWDPGVKISG